jgi:DNA-binding MarR family transcriptional regulator
MELSQLTFISMPSLSRLLKTLEGRLLIKRGRHVADLRAPSSPSRPPARRWWRRSCRTSTIYTEIEEQLGSAESEQLFRILEHVVQSLGLPGEDELGRTEAPATAQCSHECCDCRHRL